MSNKWLAVIAIVGFLILLGFWNQSRLERAEQAEFDRAVCQYTYGYDSDRCK
jgi:hypothetical protein